MAYISYDSHAPARKATTRMPRQSTIAWERIGIITASAGIWVGLIVAARAFF
jgi:hypothetical protein